MNKFEFIRDMDPVKKDLFKLNLKIKKYNYNDYVYKVGDRVKYIYFIK